MRKVLYLQWDCFGEEYICDSFRRGGLDVEMYPLPYGKISMRHDEIFEKELEEHLQNQYEFVFSFNYFPAVALTCHRSGVRYVSWTYDSPFMYLYSATIALETNLAFIFDKATVEDLRRRGVQTVQYLPMAAPVAFYDSLYSSAAIRRQFQSEVSFVGSLYTEERQDQMRYLAGVSQTTGQYLEMLIGMQLQSYAMPILERFLKPEIVAELQQVCPIPLEEDEMQSEAWMYANYFLARQVTARERTQLLEAIGNAHQLKLYTPDPTPQFPNIDNRGPVDYCNGMPYVFKNSKINLNISLKSIYTGIPLRAFDIMGCGGFLISDFQADFGELFVPDEDYVFYTTPEDLYAKTAYYLEHDEKRKQIAENGYEKVKAEHTYDHRVAQILDMI
ncbi:MAG: glycosyltransferase [Lachnospiraceae bacterium]